MDADYLMIVHSIDKPLVYMTINYDCVLSGRQLEVTCSQVYELRYLIFQLIQKVVWVKQIM